jgi:hypothetical protein
VLAPRGYRTKPGDGFWDLHLRAADYEISFSGEDPGWQVSVDRDIAHLNTDELIAQVARQIEDFTGTATEWIRIT